jgi:hypothetical protein
MTQKTTQPDELGAASCSRCLWCRKPGGTSVVKHPKTAGVPKGRYHAACLLEARKAKANNALSNSHEI